MTVPIEYRFEFDDAQLVARMRRHQALQPRARFQFVLKLLMTPFVLAFVVFAISARDWTAASMFTFLLAVSWFHVPLTEWQARRRFRDSPERGIAVRATLTALSFRATNANSEVELGWGMFSKARAFPDGFLLYEVDQSMRWLPNAALVSGTPEEVREFLREQVTDFAEVGRRKKRP